MFYSELAWYLARPVHVAEQFTIESGYNPENRSSGVSDGRDNVVIQAPVPHRAAPPAPLANLGGRQDLQLPTGAAAAVKTAQSPPQPVSPSVLSARVAAAVALQQRPRGPPSSAAAAAAVFRRTRPPPAATTGGRATPSSADARAVGSDRQPPRENDGMRPAIGSGDEVDFHAPPPATADSPPVAGDAPSPGTLSAGPPSPTRTSPGLASAGRAPVPSGAAASTVQPQGPLSVSY